MILRTYKIKNKIKTRTIHGWRRAMKEQERRDGWMDGWVGGRMNKRKHSSTYWQLISFQKKII